MYWQKRKQKCSNRPHRQLKVYKLHKLYQNMNVYKILQCQNEIPFLYLQPIVVADLQVFFDILYYLIMVQSAERC